ncbi:TPR-like protein [Linderina pennispora]|uniref:TPR-like protein n=2 Tax=Linderina TaxID=4867 RepID=A0A1Y1WB71_9FUNG|nr:TPR-like protein [Linderina pennispora]ORX70789.1 TPR-like protein [Linderina pennispora]
MSEAPVDKSAQQSASLLEKLNLSERSWKFYAAAAIPPAVVAGLALWYYSSGSPKAEPKKDEKKKRKNRKNKKSSKSAAEQGTPKEAAAEAEDVKASTTTVGGDEESPEKLTDAQIAALDKEAKKKLAQSLKTRGNKFFMAKRFPKAIEMYTQALRFDEDPVFLSNRAACYAASEENDKVIEDCTRALELEPRYVKALMRRAQAYENIDRFRDSLYDFTTACILEDFKNNLASTSAERVLKKLADASRGLPSVSFISGYLNSFRDNGTVAEGEELSEADALYNAALELIAEQQYQKAIEAVPEGVQRADDIYSLRGMFNFLKSNLDQAIADLDKALEINPKHVRSFLRKANLFTEKKELDEVQRQLDLAAATDAENAEVFFQKGQVHFLKQEFAEAAADYTKAAELDENFVYPRIQLGVVQFKVGQIEEAMRTFNAAMDKFPTRSDLYNYYGEVLAEQGGSDSAIKAFEKAVELDSKNPLPYVNQAIALFQSSGDADKALTLIRDALKVDSECELAVAALSQIYLQLGMFEESLAMLRRAVDLAKSEEEMISAITFRETTAAQFRFMREHPELLSKMMGAMM